MGDTFGVLLTCPVDAYLEAELQKRFNLLRLWETPPHQRQQLLRSNAGAIRALVGSTSVGADAATIDLLPHLEIVSTFGVKLDKVEMAKCRERGIRVTNTPDVLTDDVADLAIGLSIAVLRRICSADAYVRNGSWKTEGRYRLTSKFNGKSVGIVGLGRIGLAIAKRTEAFGCSISYHSRTEKPDTGYKYYPSISDLAAECHILMVACPLTKETHHIINRSVIDALGANGILVNIGQGALVDEPELVSALLDGRLGGAGLDVYEHEPDPPESLFQLDNVVLLPHVGSSTRASIKSMADLVMANLEAHVRNKPLLTPVL